MDISIFGYNGYPYMGSQGSLGGIHGYLGGTDGTLGPMGPWDRWDLGLKDPRYFLRVVLSIPGPAQPGFRARCRLPRLVLDPRLPGQPFSDQKYMYFSSFFLPKTAPATPLIKIKYRSHLLVEKHVAFFRKTRSGAYQTPLKSI